MPARHLLFLLIIFGNILQAQYLKPYHLNAAKDVPVFSLASGMMLSSFFLKKNKLSLTEIEIKTFDRNTINKFDRGATANWSPLAARFSDALMFGSMAMPITLAANTTMRKDFGRITVIGIETFLVNTAITSLTKELVKRKRPYVYNPDAPMHYKLKKDATSSFFSGHTSIAASMSFMVAKMYADCNPNSSGRSAVWVTAAVIPALTGLLRWKAGKHYWTDIIAGYAVGAAVGVLIPAIHNKNLTIK